MIGLGHLVNIDIVAILGLIALTQALLLAFYVVIINPKLSVAWLIAALLIIISIGLGHDVLLHSRLALWTPHMLGLGPFHSFLIGPIILLVVLKLINPQSRLTNWHWLHFIPFVIQQYFQWPVVNQPAAFKLARLETYFAQPIGHRPAMEFDWHTLIGLISFYGPRFAYLGIAVFFLIKQKSAFQHATLARQQVRRWLLYVMLGYVAFWLLLRLGLFVEPIAPILFDQMSLLNSIALSLLCLAIAVCLFKHSISEVFSIKSTQKYQKSGLDSQTSESLLNNIENTIMNQQLYSEPSLKQRQVSEAVGISNQLLSQVINSTTGANFNEYINQFRLKQVKQLLLDNNNQAQDIQAIALECGFSSKATFYRVFKNAYGCTPSQFMKQQQ